MRRHGVPTSTRRWILPSISADPGLDKRDPLEVDKIMIITGNLLLPNSGHRVRLAQGWLRLHQGHIAEIHEGALSDHPDAIGDADTLISPGLIDTHVHLPQFDIIGAHGMQLLDWLDQVTFPAEARWARTSYAEAMMERVLDQFLAHGTTSFLAYGTVHHEATRAALTATKKRGLRAALGQVLIDQEAPETMLRPREAQLEELEALLQDWPALNAQSTHRVTTAVTPRFAITCSADLMTRAARMAEDHGVLVQTHLAEMKPELEVVKALHGGPHYAGVYHKAGLLGPRSFMGHCVYLSDEELALMAETGAVAAHCPTANSFLRSGTMDRERLLDAGVKVSFGSDIGGGYERSMVRVARAAIEATFHAGREPMAAEEAWWHITEGNANALGWSQIGRLAVGAEADLLIAKPNIPWKDSVNPLGTLMFAWDDRWLRQSMVMGQSAWSCQG